MHLAPIISVDRFSCKFGRMFKKFAFIWGVAHKRDPIAVPWYLVERSRSTSDAGGNHHNDRAGPSMPGLTLSAI